jgi:hypothetical protein
VARLVSFLKSLTGFSSHQQEMVAAIVALARKGAAPAAEWLALARASGDRWKEVKKCRQLLQRVAAVAGGPLASFFEEPATVWTARALSDRQKKDLIEFLKMF